MIPNIRDMPNTRATSTDPQVTRNTITANTHLTPRTQNTKNIKNM